MKEKKISKKSIFKSKNITRRRLIKGTAVGTLAATGLIKGFPNVHAAKVYHLLASPGVPKAHLLSAPAYRDFVEKVEKRTNGRVKIKIVWGTVLNKIGEGFDSLTNGIVDMAYAQPHYYPGEFPLTEVMAMPFAFPSGVVSTRVFEELYAKYFKAEYERRNVKLLFGMQNDTYHFYTHKAIRSLKDLEGLKFRSAGALQNRALKALGIVPVTIDSSEIYSALQRKLIDGLLYPLSAAQFYKFYEICNHVTLVGLSNVVISAGINAQSLAELPKEYQDIIYGVSRENAITSARRFDEYGERGFDVFKKAGVNIVELDPKLKAELKDRVEFIWQSFIDETENKGLPGRKVAEDMRSLVEKYKDMSWQELLELQKTNPVQGLW